MLFNSYIFIIVFLPVAVTGYFLLNRLGNRFGSAFLLGVSLWFYAHYNVYYLPLIVGSIVVNYALNKLMRITAGQRARKAALMVGLALNVGVLFYYKYFDFFITSVNSVMGSRLGLLNLALPLGISFFTFQQISYLVDNYHQEVPDYSILDYALFVTFFPQLIAGPIVLHSEIVPQFMDDSKRRFNPENFARGAFAFALGLAKKVLLADVFGIAVNFGYANIATLDATNAIIVVFGYAFQMYFDFSGYCDMAIGLGLMFNIEIPANFNSPYRSRSVIEFWKRWHITLSRFFTRYVYFPLGGSRKGRARMYLNTLIVFTVSGVWHGAGWGFIIFGVNWGLAQIITLIIGNFWKKVPAFFQWLLTWVFSVMNMVFFRALTLGDAMEMFRRVFSFKFGPVISDIADAFMPMEAELLLGDIIGRVMSLPDWSGCLLFTAFAYFAVLKLKNTGERIENFKPKFSNALATVALLTLSVLSFSGVSTFLYFNF